MKIGFACFKYVHFASILYMELRSRPFGQFRSVLVPYLLALKLPLQDLIGKPASHKPSLIAETDFGGKPWFNSGLGRTGLISLNFFFVFFLGNSQLRPTEDLIYSSTFSRFVGMCISLIQNTTRTQIRPLF
jgi:hypothetical protein